MIGRRCKHSNVFSRPVLIARNLSGKPDFKPRDLSQEIYCGGYISVDPPLPIPNREVKHTGADGSAIPSVRVGSCRFSRPSSRQDSGVSLFFIGARPPQSPCALFVLYDFAGLLPFQHHQAISLIDHSTAKQQYPRPAKSRTRAVR